MNYKIISFFLSFLLTATNGSSRDAITCDFLSETVGSEISAKCKSQLTEVCNNPPILWRIFDASSKFPISGMSYSSNTDLGNFDECLKISLKTQRNETILGKYCPYSVSVANPLLPGIGEPYSQEVEDRDNNITPFTLTLLSSCVPDACTAKEVGTFFIWGTFLNGTAYESLINFQKTPCVTSETNTELKWSDIVFICFLLVILGLLVVCTAYDYLYQRLKKDRRQMFLAFSVLTNGEKLFKISHAKSKEQISCLNGLRFMSMLWVIVGHNFVASRGVPIINYAEIYDWAHNARIQYAASATIAVDTFFFLSGFLWAYSYLKRSVDHSVWKQAKAVPMMVLHRYLRLTPAVAVLYFALLTIYRFLGSGPLWQGIYESSKTTCETHWWQFFLYVQNYVNYKDMCINHTWYLSADMQMFVLAPIILIPTAILLRHNQKNVVLASIAVLCLIAACVPMIIRFVDRSKTVNTYDTHTRFVDYLIGIFLAVIMKDNSNKSFPFTKIQNFLIWAVVLLVDLAFNLYYNHVLLNYELISDNLFNNLYRLIWCPSLAWMVYSCYHGYGGPINWFLSLPVFQVGARLSYCMYLLHAVIIEYWIGIFRTNYYWGDYSIFYTFCGHFMVTVILAAIWSLAFESPMIVVEKIIFGQKR